MAASVASGIWFRTLVRSTTLRANITPCRMALQRVVALVVVSK